MTAALKDIFNEHFVSALAEEIYKFKPPFAIESFENAVFLDNNWEDKTLKERMRHITIMIHDQLQVEYREAVSILMKAAPRFSDNELAGIVFPDYVEVYGLEDWELSMEALEHFTCYSSSEFAVRPFIVQDLERMAAQMLNWAESSNPRVRRLASEGIRPRLPWGIALKSLKENPEPIIPILEKLKEDDSLYVRKSVANNLNDISKDHPDVILNIAAEWYGKHLYTDWILKHACRTLLKKGNKQALALFGFPAADGVSVENLKLRQQQLQLGETMEFSFQIKSEFDETLPIRIEYEVDYAKANGKHSKKIFKVSEVRISSQKLLQYEKTLSFKDLTTRKHYAGKHNITILINGEAKASTDFILLPKQYE